MICSVKAVHIYGRPYRNTIVHVQPIFQAIFYFIMKRARCESVGGHTDLNVFYTKWQDRRFTDERIRDKAMTGIVFYYINYIK